MPVKLTVFNKAIESDEVIEITYELEKLNLKKYISLIQISEGLEKEGVSKNDKIVGVFKMILLLSDSPVRTTKFNTTETIEVWKAILPEITDHKPDIKEAENIEIDGVVYGVSPVIVNQVSGKEDYLENGTLGEFSEASQYSDLYGQLENGAYEVLPSLAAILCRRKGEQLPEGDHQREKFIQERAKLFEEKMSMSQLLSIGFFLGGLKRQLMKDIVLYLQRVQI